MIDARLKFIKLLQRAYSGEMAAALAYRGHRKILRDKIERRAVRQIEIDEWRHRKDIGSILSDLDAKPSVFREIVFFAIGSAISFSCFFCGRFLATYFAGRLESGNVLEYQQAFDLAEEIGLAEYCEEFFEMRETESRHERILYEMVENHPLLPVFSFIFGWGKTGSFVTESRNVKF